MNVSLFVPRRQISVVSGFEIVVWILFSESRFCGFFVSIVISFSCGFVISMCRKSRWYRGRVVSWFWVVMFENGVIFIVSVWFLSIVKISGLLIL